MNPGEHVPKRTPQNQGLLKIQGAVQLVSEIHVVPLPSLLDMLKLTDLTFNRFMCPGGAAFRSTCHEVVVNDPDYRALIRHREIRNEKHLPSRPHLLHLYQKLILLQWLY